MPKGVEHLRGLAVSAQKDRLVRPPVPVGVADGGKSVSGQFEAVVLGCLFRGVAGLAAEDVITENQLRALAGVNDDAERSDAAAMLEAGTPDILLRQPLRLNGRFVHWVECKMGWTAPGLSAASKVASLKRQLQRYRDNYGPGMVVWNQGVFESTVQLVSGVQHLSMRR